ncbi:MAG: Hsp70 family protein [Promethearchaeota archaeon]
MSKSFNKEKGKFWQKYFPSNKKIEDKKVAEFRKFFKRLLFSNYKKDLEDFYEIISDYENIEIRKIAQDILKTEIKNLSDDKLDVLFRQWLKYPVQQITNIFSNIDERLKNSYDEKFGTYYLIKKIFDKNEKISFTEEELIKIEEFIKPYPLLYLPIQRRINLFRREQLRNKIRHEQQIVDNFNKKYRIKLNKVIFDKSLLMFNSPRIIWERLINSSIITIIEYFPQIQFFKKWAPSNKIEHELFDIIKETFQDKGWNEHQSLLLESIYNNLNEFYQYNFNFKLNPYILGFPDKIDYTNLNLENINVEQSHYSQNKIILNIKYKDLQLYQLTFNSISDIKPINKNGSLILNNSIEIDLVFLISLIKPLIYLNKYEIKNFFRYFQKDYKDNNLDEKISNIIRKNKKYIHFIRKIIEFSIQRKYNLKFIQELEDLDKSLKIIKTQDEIRLKKDDIKKDIILSIDFGNYKTTISAIEKNSGKIISGNDLLNEEYIRFFKVNEKGIKIHSIIFIHPEKGKLFGKKHDKNLLNESFIIWNMKQKIRNNLFSYYNILGKSFDLLESIRDFISFIFNAINWHKYNLSKLGFAYPVDSSPEYRTWLKEILIKIFNLHESIIYDIDEATANCLGLVYLKNFELDLEKVYLIIDIGGGTTDCAILQFKSLDGKNIEIFSRRSESIGGSSIEKQLFFEIKRENNIRLDLSKKDKIVYLLGKRKLNIYKKKSDFEQIKINNIDYEINEEIINDIIKKRELDKKIIKIIKECIEDGRYHGVKTIDFVILTGGGCKTPLFYKKITDFCKENIKNASIIHINEDFSISLGLQTLFSDINIQARILEDFCFLEFNNINPQFLEFNKLIKRNTRFPTPFYHYKLYPFEYNNTKINLLHFYIIREIINEYDDEWDLALIKTQLDQQSLFIAERITDQYIVVPNINRNSGIDLYFKIDPSKKLLLFFKTESANNLKMIELGKIR